MKATMIRDKNTIHDERMCLCKLKRVSYDALCPVLNKSMLTVKYDLKVNIFEFPDSVTDHNMIIKIWD